jgi:RND family efflux transporter MFP subunit
MVKATEEQLLAPGNPVVRIVEMDRLCLEVGVGASVVNSLAPGEEALVYVKALDQEFTARLETVSPAADPRTKQYAVEVELPNADLELKPGMLAEVELVRAVAEDVVVVPCQAVITREEVTYVFVVDEGEARERPVVTGIDNGQSIAILEGLSPGDKVVVKGQEFLSAGAAVRIRNEENGGSSQ